MAPSRVRTTGKVTAASAASIALTFATPPPLGNSVIVAVLQFGNATTAPTCSDNRGNPYLLGPSQNQSSWERASIFYCAAVGATGAPFTITVTSGAVSNWTALAIEVAGGIALDQSAAQSGSLTTPVTSGMTPALTAADVLEVAALAIGSGMTFITVETVSPAWLEECEELPTTTCAGEVDSRSCTGVSGTTPSCSWSLQNGTEWSAGLAAFKATALPGVETAQPYVWGPL